MMRITCDQRGPEFLDAAAADSSLEGCKDGSLAGALHCKDEGEAEALAVAPVELSEPLELLRLEAIEPGSLLLALRIGRQLGTVARSGCASIKACCSARVAVATAR